MYHKKTRVGAFLLALVLMFSMVGTALAAYNPDKVVYPKRDEHTGEMTFGDFMPRKTRLSEEPIWVLTQFKDQEIINQTGKYGIADSIKTARECGVAIGDQNGNFNMAGICNGSFMIAFIERYFHETGLKGGKDIAGRRVDFDFKVDGNVPKYPGNSGENVNRLTGILYAAREADIASPGIKLGDFSKTKLGEYTRPRKVPGSNRASIDIWPHNTNGIGFRGDTCKNLNMFIPEDQKVFTGEYCQAANLLMYAGVLVGGTEGVGLQGHNNLLRGEMVRLLVTMGDNLEHTTSVPDEVRLSASLEMSADDIDLNYKDLDNGVRGTSEVVFDGSRSEGDSFEITGNSNTLGSLGTISNSSSGTKRLTFTKKTIMEMAKRPASTPARELAGRKFTDTVSGKIVATASGRTETKGARTDINIYIINDKPAARFVVKTDRLPEYAENFFYIKNPVTITDSSVDPEDALRRVQYGIFKDGACVATITDFDTVDTLPEFVDRIKPNDKDKTINLTFNVPGTYTIKVTVTDECSAQSEKERTIVVTGEPAAPTAVIRTNKYAFIDTPTAVKDASTDPNNDIVQWDWADIQFKDKETFSPATGVTKTGLQDGKGASKPSSVDGSLSFAKKGLYQLGLTVTDATALASNTTATIKVIENIPVPDPDPEPVDPNPDPDPSPNPSTSPDPNPDPSPDPTTPPYDDGGFPHWEGDTLVVKQNRLFVINLSNSLNPPASPILWDKTEWIVKPIGNYDISTLKLDKKNSTLKSNHYLSKTEGEFTITIILHNKYSDDLAISDPTNEDLPARETTIQVKVLPDIKPLVALQVEGAHPNFHENPSSVNVKVVATTTLPDHDFIDYYDWTLVRDSNKNNIFTDDAVLQSIKKAKQSEIAFGVKFQLGNTSPYQAKVKVTEKFGQPTINEFIKPEDFRSNETTQNFDVNWRPCISYTIRDFAYTDDTLNIQSVLKDENIGTCVVDWSLWKKTGTIYTPVPTDSLPIWAFDNNGGQLQIPTDGFYRLQAVITDKEGNTETFYPDKDIRIYHLPVAVISDAPEYRWKTTPFQFKESRKFKLDGNASFVDDSTGKALHQLNRNNDEWSITPLDGQNAENIYVSNSAGTDRIISHDTTIFTIGANQFDETLAILDPGRYQVTYQVINTFGKKSPVITQIITIDEDLPPIISGAVEPVVNRGPVEGGADVILSIGNLEFKSPDNDLIGDYQVELTYDSNNDGSYADETHEILREGIDFTIDSKKDGYLQITVELKRHDIGHYQFKVTLTEVFGQETLPFVPETERRTVTRIWETEIDNVRPTGTFSTRTVTKGDIVFAIGDSTVTKEIQNATKTFKNKFGDEASLSMMDVNVEMVETTKVNMESSFEWKQDLDSSIGQIWFADNGSTVNMVGNRSRPGKNAIYINSDEKVQTFQFDYNVDFGDSFNAAGFLFGLYPKDNNLVGYGIIFTGGYMQYSGCRLISITWPIGTNQNNISYSDITSLSAPQSGTMQLQINNDAIAINIMNGIITNNIHSGSLPHKQGGGFGFFSDHHSHGCDQIGSFALTNIQMSVTKVKNLSDALSNVSWRDGAERFVIYVDDKKRDEMNQGPDTAFAKLMASLMGENIHLIALGSDTNAAQLQELIRNLTQKGAYFNNYPHTTALDNAADFIKSILLTVCKDTMYVLLGDKINYTKLYSDFNGDPQWLFEPTTYKEFQKNPSLLAQRWKFYHNPTYYDNSMGLSDISSTAEVENWIAKDTDTLSKPGKYLIDYQIKDNPVPNRLINMPSNPFHEYRYWSKNYANDKVNDAGEIVNPYAELYVHRKPLAEFSFVANKIYDVVKSVVVSDKAYDLDHEFRDPHKGLNLYEWKWKFASDTGWRKEGLFTNPNSGVKWLNEQLVNLDSVSQSNILIQYRVRDIDGFSKQETIRETRQVGGRWTVTNQTYNMNQGAWSDAKTIWITNEAQIPVARFKTTNNTYVIGDTIGITDNSYSPNGDAIAMWEFTITRNNGPTTTLTYTETRAEMEAAATVAISNWINQQKLALKAEDNHYQISLIVTDAKRIPLSSDPYVVNIQITSINLPPDVTIPDTENPNEPGGPDGGGTSLWGKNNPTIYEYDTYDADKTNSYYTYGGAIQKRGTELLDWSLVLSDQDNNDGYGDANDTDEYNISFKIDRFLSSLRSNIMFAAVSSKTYPTKTLTAAQAMNNNWIAPFKTALEGNSGWGAYKITTSVTDIPVNGTKGKTTIIETHPDKKPLHLYVIPKLEVRDVHYVFNDIQDNQELISPGEPIFVTAITNDRSTGCRVICKDGEGADVSQELTLAAKNENGTYAWSGTFIIPGDLEEEDLLPGNKFPFGIQTYTTYGSREGEETREKTDPSFSLNILPLKLYDFKITGITDQAVQSVNHYPITVRDLAFDERDTTQLMKCGYAVNFELRSKGLKSNTDSVRMRPTFWGYNNGTGQYDIQLDMYYRNDNHQYVKATTDPNGNADAGDEYQIFMKGSKGTLLGTLRELLLPTKVRTLEFGTQKWTARYGIPGSAVFVVKGQPLTENSLYQGKVLMMFDFEAMKNGVPKYNYIGKGQWNLERKDENGAFLNTQKAYYRDGSVLVIDSGKSSLDNYESRPVWTK